MKKNDVSHEHAPIDSYFAPIPGGEVPETFSPFAPIPIPEDDGLPADLGPRFSLDGNKRVLLALLTIGCLTAVCLGPPKVHDTGTCACGAPLEVRVDDGIASLHDTEEEE